MTRNIVEVTCNSCDYMFIDAHHLMLFVYLASLSNDKCRGKLIFELILDHLQKSDHFN